MKGADYLHLLCFVAGVNHRVDIGVVHNGREFAFWIAQAPAQ